MYQHLPTSKLLLNTWLPNEGTFYEWSFDVTLTYGDEVHVEEFVG